MDEAPAAVVSLPGSPGLPLVLDDQFWAGRITATLPLFTSGTSPLHYYMDAAFGILLKGARVQDLCRSILGMVVLGSIVFGFGLWRFRRQFR